MNESVPTPAPEVRHNAASHRYEIESEDLLAHLDYVQDGEVTVFTHTWVPPEWRGRNVAGTLVKTALEDARRNSLRIVPQCSYVARYLERHPEFADLVAGER